MRKPDLSRLSFSAGVQVGFEVNSRMEVNPRNVVTAAYESSWIPME